MRALVLVLACAACTALPWQPPEDKSVSWRVLHEGESLGGPMLAVWGSGTDHAVLVGGTVGNGGESLVYLWDGNALSAKHPGGTDTFWWVHGTARDDVWMVGEHGRITHFDGSVFVDQARPVDTTLWGVIAFARDDVWAVGGMPGRPTGAPNDVVLHFDGTAWTQEVLPGTPRKVALLKAWGTSSENLYVVGEQATIWHRTASGWTLESPGPMPLTEGTLFSINGCSATEIYAVGGSAVLRFDGNAWSRLDVPEVANANGVVCSPGRTVVVGFAGLKVRLENGATVDDTRQQPYLDLHAAWADGAGNIWVVGGDWLSSSMPGVTREAVVARYGGPVKAELRK